MAAAGAEAQAHRLASHLITDSFTFYKFGLLMGIKDGVLSRIMWENGTNHSQAVLNMISEAWSVTMGVNEFEKWFDNVIEKCEKKYECEALKSRSAVTSPDPIHGCCRTRCQGYHEFPRCPSMCSLRQFPKPYFCWQKRWHTLINLFTHTCLTCCLHKQ